MGPTQNSVGAKREPFRPQSRWPLTLPVMMGSTRSITSSFRGVCPTPSVPSISQRRWLITAAPSLDRRFVRRDIDSPRCFTSLDGSIKNEGESSSSSPSAPESDRSSSVSKEEGFEGLRERSESNTPSADVSSNNETAVPESHAGDREHPDSLSGSKTSTPDLASLFGDAGDFHKPFSGSANKSKENPGPLNWHHRSSDSASRSPYANLFDTPDPFAKVLPKRDGAPGGFHMGGLSKRSEAEGALGRNQWSGRRSTGRSGQALRLSAQERKQWMKVLGSVADVFADGKMGKFASRNDLVNPDTYRARKQTLGGGSNANRLAALREGLSAEISPQEMENGVDAAKQEMNAKVHEADLWEWAIKNIWGFDELALRQAAHDILTQGKEALPASSWVSEAQFGVGTPFYAPVLHRLLVHFRDRLKAPNSALSVLGITRALGPQSFVLGCTPELYSEALTTMYFWMHDLRGCLVLLQEARDLGVLSDALGDRATNEPETTYHTTSLPGIIQTIQNDVSNKTLGIRAELQHKKMQNNDKSSTTMTTDDNAAPEEDYLSELNSLFDQDGIMSDPTPDHHQVNLESLSLPALDALRIVEEMNSILDVATKASKKGDKGEDDAASMEGFGFDSPGAPPSKSKLGAAGRGKWSSGKRYSRKSPATQQGSKSPSRPPTRLGPKAYLHPSARDGF